MSVQTIQPQDLQRMREQGKLLEIIDVRTPAEYAQVHVEGARSVPLNALDPKSLLASRNPATDDPFYVICQSGGRAARACEMLGAAGFANVFSVAGGTAAWERARFPVVRGARGAISLERQVRIAAGSLVLLGVLLGWFVHPTLLALAALVGAGLVFAGVTDWCGMGLLLARMPWNRSVSDVE